MAEERTLYWIVVDRDGPKEVIRDDWEMAKAILSTRRRADYRLPESARRGPYRLVIARDIDDEIAQRSEELALVKRIKATGRT